MAPAALLISFPAARRNGPLDLIWFFFFFFFGFGLVGGDMWRLVIQATKKDNNQRRWRKGKKKSKRSIKKRFGRPAETTDGRRVSVLRRPPLPKRKAPCRSAHFALFVHSHFQLKPSSSIESIEAMMVKVKLSKTRSTSWKPRTIGDRAMAAPVSRQSRKTR